MNESACARVFLSRDALHKRGLCCRAVSVHLSLSCIMSKRINISSKFFTILVFPYRTLWQYFDEDPAPSNRDVEWRYSRQSYDFRLMAGFRIDDW